MQFNLLSSMENLPSGKFEKIWRSMEIFLKFLSGYATYISLEKSYFVHHWTVL